MAATISLKTGDGDILAIDVEILKQSSLIKEMMEKTEDENCQEPIPVPSIENSETLKAVIEWATHHQKNLDEPMEPKQDSEEPKSIIGKWDEEFLAKFEIGPLFELTMAADFLHFNRLLDVSCSYIANIIKSKEVDELKVLFQILASQGN